MVIGEKRKARGYGILAIGNGVLAIGDWILDIGYWRYYPTTFALAQRHERRGERAIDNWQFLSRIRSNDHSQSSCTAIDCGLRKSQKKQVSAIFSCAFQKNVVPLSRKDNTTHETIF